jgi:hypothetical protein
MTNNNFQALKGRCTNAAILRILDGNIYGMTIILNDVALSGPGNFIEPRVPLRYTVGYGYIVLPRQGTAQGLTPSSKNHAKSIYLAQKHKIL